jgi:O-antigen/teichoic acid export membrane protein
VFTEFESGTLAEQELLCATQTRSKELMRNGLFTSAGVIAAGLAGLVTVPLFLKWLGAEGYALIVSTAAIATLLSCLETGLSLSVTREVASNNADSEFFSSAATAYVIFAGITFLVAAVSILGFGTAIHASSLTRRDTEIAALLFAFAFAVERIFDFSLATLAGLGRFDISSSLSASLIILRSVISVIVLCAGGRLIGVGLTYAACSLGIAIASVFISCTLAKARIRYSLSRWSRLQSWVNFSAVVTTTALFQNLINDGRMLLTGYLSGWVGVATLSAGQKFPQAICDVSWRAAETMVPFAARMDEDDIVSSNCLFRDGTHHILMLVVPSCVFLLITAPTLIRLWLGDSMAIAVSVLRWTSIAIILDAIGLAAIQLLWGKGHARFLLRLQVCSSAACLGITAFLVPKLGVAGAAVGLIGSSLVASTGALAGIQRLCRVNVIEALRNATVGLAIPLSGLIVSTMLLSRFLDEEPGRMAYISLLAVSATVYLALLLLFGMVDGCRASIARLGERLLGRKG